MLLTGLDTASLLAEQLAFHSSLCRINLKLAMRVVKQAKVKWLWEYRLCRTLSLSSQSLVGF